LKICGQFGKFLLPDKFAQMTNVEKKAAQNFSLWKNPDAGKNSGSFGNCILPSNFGQMIKVEFFMYSQTFQALWKNPDTKKLGQFWNFYVAQ
jgi:hypothetical protein